jgi:hypothetical protein
MIRRARVSAAWRATKVGAYLAETEGDRARTLSAYRLLLVPGLELRYNESDHARHAVAVGLPSFVAIDDGPASPIEKVGAADQRTSTGSRRFF